MLIGIAEQEETSEYVVEETRSDDITDDFTDPFFREYVLKKYSPNEVRIYREDIYNITEIDIDGDSEENPNHVVSLADIEHFVNLESLYCSYNMIEELDLGKKLRLETVIAYGNKIKKGSRLVKFVFS